MNEAQREGKGKDLFSGTLLRARSPNQRVTETRRSVLLGRKTDEHHPLRACARDARKKNPDLRSRSLGRRTLTPERNETKRTRDFTIGRHVERRITVYTYKQTNKNHVLIDRNRTKNTLFDVISFISTRFTIAIASFRLWKRFSDR